MAVNDELEKRLNMLKAAVNNALDNSDLDVYHKEFLDRYKKQIAYIEGKLNNGQLQSSEGKATLGLGRAISEDDFLSNIDELYDAAYAADKFYKENYI